MESATLPLTETQPDEKISAVVFWPRRVLSLWMAVFFWGYIIVLFPLYALLLNLQRQWAYTATHYLNIGWGAVIMLSGGIWVRTRYAAPLGKGPYIFVANHSSYMDIPLCHVALPRNFRCIAKDELSRVPLFGYMYQRLHIMLKRDSGRDALRALAQAETHLKQGTSVFVYPEGTTRHAGKMGEFKEGAFYLAVRNGVPIVPIAINNSRARLSNDGRFLPTPGLSEVKIMEPIQTAGMKTADVTALMAHIKSLILAELN